MFDSLSDRLHDVFRKLRGQSTLSEDNISESMREIRIALLEADVNINVATKFIEDIKGRCIGHEVLKSVTPGQQVVKIVHDKLVEFLGSDASELKLTSKPSVIMMVGLHGSGKTTTAAKLALKLKGEGKKVLLVAGDVYRPAAIDQLEFVGKEVNVPVHAERTSVNVSAIALNAVNEARKDNTDVVIIDTAGRLQIDDTMVQELIRIRQTVSPDEILLVADSALGQEAVSVAEHFNKALGLTGIILTKLDGDARGGAALSMRKVTNCPVKFVGVGEKLNNLEIFYPDRMAGRILGMGDVVSLVEQASEKIDEEEAKKLHERLKKNKFDYNDFLTQLKQISKLGGLEGILKFLPGGKQISSLTSAIDPKYLSSMEAVIMSMTKYERENPDAMNFSRKKRIAKGSGVAVEMVSTLINQFETMRKMMKPNGAMGRLMNGGSIADNNLGGFFGGSSSAILNKKEQDKRKKIAKLQKKNRAKQRKKK